MTMVIILRRGFIREGLTAVVFVKGFGFCFLSYAPPLPPETPTNPKPR